MIKILPKMSTQRLQVKERLFQGGGAVVGLESGGRASHLRTDLKRRSSEMTTETADDGKRTRRPSEGGGGGKHHRRLRKQRKRARTNNAPFNSTQFLMSDHGGDTIQFLDSTLGVSKGGSSERRHNVVTKRVTRARESSFSLDSDEDFYYSSPEDEEEFVSREFIKEYNRMKECVRTDRLSDMSKADLIQEYLQMEQKVDSLEKRLNRRKSSTTNGEGDQTDSSSSEETAEQIRVFQREILRLESENERLRSANVVLMQQKKPGSDVTDDGDDVRHDDDGNSSCSTCSSSSSDSGSESDSSDDSEEEEDEEQALFALPAKADDVISGLEKTVASEKATTENDKDDTGYESSHSGSIIKQTAADNSSSVGNDNSTIATNETASSNL